MNTRYWNDINFIYEQKLTLYFKVLSQFHVITTIEKFSNKPRPS